MPGNYINLDDLKTINQGLKSDIEKINSLYTNSVANALINCQEDLKVSGLNYDEVQNSFKNVFTSLTAQLTTLTDAMDSKIIPQYEATASSIIKLFNQDFANEMSDYIRIINGN